MIHILFKTSENNYYSEGKTYEGDVCEAFNKWRQEYPNAIFLALYETR
jgi:hypothetical protein